MTDFTMLSLKVSTEKIEIKLPKLKDNSQWHTYDLPIEMVPGGPKYRHHHRHCQLIDW